MLTALRRSWLALTTVCVLMLAMLVIAAPSHADDGDCLKWDTDALGNKICTIHSPGSPGKPGGPGNGFDIQCTNNHITYEGQDYVCNLPDGWSFSYGCYIKLMEPQPPAGDPMWGKADPSTSRMQYVSCGVMPPTVPGNRQPVPGPCVGTCGGLDPVQGVTNQLAIDKPSLGMAPSGGPGATGFVNQNVWFWSKGLDTSTQARQAGNVVGVRTFVNANWTITRANPSGTVATLHCTTDNEYTADKGSAPSPDPNCGYQFKDPGDYTVTLTTTWSLVITQNGVPDPGQTVTSTPSTTTITIIEGESNNG